MQFYSKLSMVSFIAITMLALPATGNAQTYGKCVCSKGLYQISMRIQNISGCTNLKNVYGRWKEERKVATVAGKEKRQCPNYNRANALGARVLEMAKTAKGKKNGRTVLCVAPGAESIKAFYHQGYCWAS